MGLAVAEWSPAPRIAALICFVPSPGIKCRAAAACACRLGPQLKPPVWLQKAKTVGPHHPSLLHALAAKLGCEAGDIVDFELNVCDTQPGVIGGVTSILLARCVAP